MTNKNRFGTSVVSYPGRGHYGNNKYRGNCTGLIVRDFVGTYLKQGGLFADPSIGGGTTKDVAEEMGIRFFGTDLHQGFNLLTDDFQTAIGEQANLVWWHPPYWDMIRYSGSQWGEEPHKWDMSHMNLNDFCEAFQLSMMNIHDAVEKGGHYGILMGNLRRNGAYYNLSAMVERAGPGRLVDEIIKIQHNCVSDKTQYSGSFVRIAHEKLLVFKKEAPALVYLTRQIQRCQTALAMTWKAAVRRILQKAGQSMSLAEIYAEVRPFAEAKGTNNNWQAKVRQVLQDKNLFVRVETGVFTLNV